MRFVNIGCGGVFHQDWINLDVVPIAPEVRRLDARNPLPFEDDTVDAVYHSHVLEHLTEADGLGLLKECRRVLRSGGILRVVVPDLEGIARAYLQALEIAAGGGDTTLYAWCRLELTDQLARVVSGGEMARWLSQLNPQQLELVRTRSGSEIAGILGMRRVRVRGWTGERLRRAARRAHDQLVKAVVFLLGGARRSKAYGEGLFRNGGEVHRVMYDRCSLARLLSEAGFGEIRVVGAAESGIAGFSKHDLDVVDGRIRKPDSLFMEAVKR